MPKPKLNLKKHSPSVIRSKSPKRIITFHNSINDIINKFENSKNVDNHFALNTKTSIKHLSNDNPPNNCTKLKIYGNNFCSTLQLKSNSLNKSVGEMVDSISDDVIDSNYNDGSSDDIHINNVQPNDSIEMNEMISDIETIDNDSNIYEYIPFVAEPIVPSTTKFMSLKNINIVRYQLNMFQRFIGILLSFPFFSSINGAGLSTLIFAFFLPRILCENILYPVFRLILGTLYPAYASYKAVRNKDVKDYVSNCPFKLIKNENINKK